MTKTIEAMQSEVNAALDARLAYEVSKNADNLSIQKHIKNIRADFSHATIASVLVACSYDAATINASERVTARRNIYSIAKDANIARAIAKVESLNHFTLAIFKSALALEAAEMFLTHKDAASACSLDVKNDNAARERIIKANKYAKHIAANTASTQSSSSINALVALNVLTANDATSYKLNRDSESFKRLQAAIA